MAAPSRLSPAANLLRNSKLFALPSAIPLPPPKPTAEPTAKSDTATTIYPTRAAIATPNVSLRRGDWGLKRALPLKSTTDTSTPSIRLTKEIDSSGHVTDFESAADHVQTHAKWQDVHFQIRNRPEWANDSTAADARKNFSVFSSEYDNATIQRPPPEPVHQANTNTPQHLLKSLQELHADRKAAAERSGQSLPPFRTPRAAPVPTRRWRYEGPWLAGMSELEFEAYLKHMDKQKIAAFETFLKNKIRANTEKMRQKAGENTVTTDAEQLAPVNELSPIEVTDQDLADQLRKLRQDPAAFGPEIAEFLDLPEGAKYTSPSILSQKTAPRAWEYNRDTVASRSYQTVGPPRTHPSAGFSYVRSNQYAKNSLKYGPQQPNYHLPARILKDRLANEDGGRQAFGVGGFVARSDSKTIPSQDLWRPQKGGTKAVAKLQSATVAQDGRIEVKVTRPMYWTLSSENVPRSTQEMQQEQEARSVANMPGSSRRMDTPLDSYPVRYKKAEEVDTGKPSEQSEDVFEALQKAFQRGRAK